MSAAVMAPDSLLSVDAVERRHGNGRGVGPVSLQVEQGTCVALMGPNGAGKTTLLRMLATIDAPRGGAVRWFGGTSTIDARRRLGFAPDVVQEEASLTARQATHFWCRQWLGRAEMDGRVQRALATFGLDSVADEPVARFSFGMRRRLALAQALVHDPALLLLDEPTAGLDPAGARALYGALRERCAAGMTAVIASNDCAFVATACDRVIFLHEGRAIRDASPAALLAELGTRRRAELELRVPCDAEELLAVAGVAAVSENGRATVVELATAGALVSVVAIADKPGGNLCGLRVREPDLADAFWRMTGTELLSAESA